MENSQRPAHPTNGRMHDQMTGLTKRELIAAMAMQAYLSSDNRAKADHVAQVAIRNADELLKQLEHGA
jgi:hypothetical protein